MTAIWQNDGSAWRLLSPAGFPDESALHGLVEHAPHILPLAGVPQLIVVGREVLLGGNSADLIAVESTGRLAVIEIKLAKNAEERRAVVAQILAYAAYLHGIDAIALERDVLGAHLQKRGFDSLAAAAAASDQTDSFDAAVFESGLQESLQEGRFRLVLVLDDAPAELVRLTGYLETVTDKLIIDLVVMTSYEVDGRQLVVPQRVDAERQLERSAITKKPRINPGSSSRAPAHSSRPLLKRHKSNGNCSIAWSNGQWTSRRKAWSNFGRSVERQAVPPCCRVSPETTPGS